MVYFKNITLLRPTPPTRRAYLSNSSKSELCQTSFWWNLLTYRRCGLESLKTFPQQSLILSFQAQLSSLYVVLLSKHLFHIDPSAQPFAPRWRLNGFTPLIGQSRHWHGGKWSGGSPSNWLRKISDGMQLSTFTQVVYNFEVLLLSLNISIFCYFKETYMLFCFSLPFSVSYV